MSIADEIAKLKELRADGSITEAEFEKQKQALLSGAQADGDVSPEWDRIPLRRKWLFHVAALLLLPPAGILLTLLVPAYRKVKAQPPTRVGKGFKAISILIACAIWGSYALPLMGVGGLPGCASSNAKNTLSQAFDRSQMARTLNLSAVQVMNATTKSGSTDQHRQCSADLSLNNGNTVTVDFDMIPQKGGTFLLNFSARQ